MDRYFPLILIVSLVSFVDFLDATMVFMIGPDISDYFDVGISDASWLVMGYDLILCALIIPMARVAKAGYTRTMLVSGLALFTFGTVMCSLSESYWMLIAFRVVQGAGAVLAVSTLPVIIVSLFPDDMQGRVAGAMLTGAGAGMVLAPIIGSWLVENVGWQYAFLVAVPACIVALALSLKYVSQASEKSEFHIDIVGTVLTVTLIGTTLMFFEDVIDGGAIVILYAAVAVVSAVLLAVHIRRGGDRGLITHSIVANKEFRVLAISMLTAVMLVEGMMFLIPFVLLGEFKMEMFEAGLFFALVSVSVVLLSIPVGRICENRGCRAIIMVGCVIAVVFSIAFVAIDATWPILLLVVVLLAVGASYAIFETAHYVRLIKHVPGPLKDEAATFGTMISFLGASLGVAVFDIAVDLTLNDIPIEAVHTAALLAAVMAAVGAITTLMIKDKAGADQRAALKKDKGFGPGGSPRPVRSCFLRRRFLGGRLLRGLGRGFGGGFPGACLGAPLRFGGGVGVLAEAEEPVVADLVVLLLLDPVLGGAAGSRGGEDDVHAGSPVGGGRDVLLVCLLQGEDDPLDLVEVPAEGRRVVDHRPDDALRVDEEHGPDGLGVGDGGLDHSILLRDIHLDVLDQGELDLDVLHLLPFDVLDLPEPGDVGVDGVDGESDELDVQGLELLGHAAECHELRGTHGGEIGGVGEQDDPFAFEVGGEVDLSLGGVRFESRGGLSDHGHPRGAVFAASAARSGAVVAAVAFFLFVSH